MRFCGVILFCLIFLLFLFGKAVAGEVYLKNGDRITGEVISMEQGKLVFETSYAGRIRIDWAEVSEIKTDDPITVILSNETLLQGVPTAGEEGQMKLQAEMLEEPVSFKISEVKAINPRVIPAVRWTARINFGLKVEGGNTDKEEFHMDTQIVSRTDTNRFTAALELDRDEADDVRTENKWLALTKYDHFLTEKWYLNTNASYEKDDFKEINARAVLGAGVGYQPWHSDLRNLSAELGYAYVNESYDDNTPDKDYSSYRWAMNFDHFLFQKIVQLFHWDEVILSADDSDDIWLRSRTGLRFPLYKGLSWTLQYNLDWDNQPTPGQGETDTTLLFTLGYQYNN